MLEKEDEPYIEPNELALNSFYNDTTTTPLHENYTTEQRSLPINPLIVEEEMNGFDFANHDIHNSFRRRRGDGGIDTANISCENDALISNTNYHNNSFTQQQHHQHLQDFTSNNTTTHKSKQKHLTWNRLNATLFIGQALLSIATTAPITLVPHFALSLAGSNEDETWNYSPYYNMEILEVYDENGNRKRWIPFRVRRSNGNNNNNNEINSSSIFASHLTAIVTLGTAMGKFINGLLVDLAGARRLLLVYGICTGLALIGLRYSETPGSAIACCALIEFFNSINWPANIVILGAHYGTSGGSGNTADSDGMFERGLYVTSLACRCGSLLIIPLSSLLIKWTSLTWRGVTGIASFAAFSAVVVFYIYLTDSPGKRHDPQNPISEQVEKKKTLYSNVPSQNAYHPTFHSWTPKQQTISERASKFVKSVFITVLPSIRAVLKSRVFWAVAIAHAGATMVKSSERILGTYFRDTSYGVVTESKAGAMTVFLSLGMLMGLLVGGKAFARAAEKEEQGNNNIDGGRGGQSSLIDAAQVGTKNMIAFFYCLSICSCYILSFLAMPFVRKALHLPVLVLILQVITTLFLGFGIAVQYYHIPAIVGATYGKNRGLYTAYTDGVAALVSSIVWRIVGGAVEEGNPQGAGWSYGWAGLALLLVFCGTLMIKVVELYLIGGGWHHNSIPTIHESSKTPDETEHLIDLNTSWMDEEIQTVKPLRNPTRELNVLSSSALDFIHHSPMRHKYGRKSLLATVESRDEEEDTTVSGGGVEVDLLGIDDDGSLLIGQTHPISSSIANDLVSFKPTFDDDEDTDIRATSTFSDI